MLMAIVMAFLMCMGGVGSVGSILAGKWSGRLALRFCGFVVYIACLNDFK